jgi:hypothetical protein
MSKRILVTLIFLGTVMMLEGDAWADVIAWTDWTSFTAGTTNGTATGTIGSVGVSYSGQVLSNSNTNNTAGGVSWGPASTFSGGSISNPPPFRDIITLQGGTGTGTNTIRFSTPVVDPVMAIWSLGAPGALASFVFTASEPFTIQSGGPSNEFAGSSITQSGNVVNGVEGNGTIRFSGTFSEITWTNPQSEFFYGFTTGIAGAVSPVPEPSTWLLVASVIGLLWLCYGRRLRRWPARRVEVSRNC